MLSYSTLGSLWHKNTPTMTFPDAVPNWQGPGAPGLFPVLCALHFTPPVLMGARHHRVIANNHQQRGNAPFQCQEWQSFAFRQKNLKQHCSVVLFLTFGIFFRHSQSSFQFNRTLALNPAFLSPIPTELPSPSAPISTDFLGLCQKFWFTHHMAPHTDPKGWAQTRLPQGNSSALSSSTNFSIFPKGSDRGGGCGNEERC